MYTFPGLRPLVAQKLIPRFFPVDPGPEAVIEALRAMNYGQIDTISVYWRAHEHILSLRSGTTVDEQLLNQLQGQGDQPRRIFEYWYHAAAFLPLEDAGFCLWRMKMFREKYQQWYKDHSNIVSAVLERIEAEGPLSSSNFSSAQKSTGSGWWNWKPAKVALDMLFHSGQLVVSHRTKFKKYYDIPQRAIPQLGHLSVPSPQEQAAYLLNTTLDTHPVCRVKDIPGARRWGNSNINELVQEWVQGGILRELQLEGSKDLWVCRPDLLGDPAHAQFIGSADLKYHRKIDEIVVQNLVRDVPWTKDMEQAVAQVISKEP